MIMEFPRHVSRRRNSGLHDFMQVDDDKKYHELLSDGWQDITPQWMERLRAWEKSPDGSSRVGRLISSAEQRIYRSIAEAV